MHFEKVEYFKAVHDSLKGEPRSGSPITEQNHAYFFFRGNGPILLSYLERGKTLDIKSYIDCCLKPIDYTFNSQKLTTGIKKIKFQDENTTTCSTSYL